MDTSTALVYDGSFNGFLSCMYAAFEHKGKVTAIKKSETGEQELFANVRYVPTSVALAKLVWNGINQNRNAAIKTIYFAFLSETEGVEMLIYTYIRYVMGAANAEELEKIPQISNSLCQLEEKVAKEKRRMEAFASFQLREDKVYFAEVKPKYNVLPLLSKHIKAMFKDKEWYVYDSKRHFGMGFTNGILEFTSNNPKISVAV